MHTVKLFLMSKHIGLAFDYLYFERAIQEQKTEINRKPN